MYFYSLVFLCATEMLENENEYEFFLHRTRFSNLVSMCGCCRCEKEKSSLFESEGKRQQRREKARRVDVCSKLNVGA